MSEITNLTIKISVELKEKIKAIALEKNLSLSAVVCEHLENSLNSEHKAEKKSKKHAEDFTIEVDSSDTEEHLSEPQLSQAELKKLRQLIKASTKSHGKKK